MAEKRFISRRITESDKIRELANAGKLLPVTLYTFLLPYLDREGRMNANPLLLKGGLFEGYAWTIEELERAVHDLASVGLVRLYSNGRFGHLIQYEKFLTSEGGFNNPHANEAASELPGPDDAGSAPVQRTSSPASPVSDDAPAVPMQGSGNVAAMSGQGVGLHRVRDRDREGVRENPLSAGADDLEVPKPVPKNPGNKKPGIRSIDQPFVDAWNEHRGMLSRVLTVDKERARNLDRLRRELGDEALSTFIDAVKQVSTEKTYLEGGYGFGNLLTGGKVVNWAEKWRSGGGLSEGNRKLAATAAQVAKAIGGME